jgi:hypothetical protein
VIYNQPRGLNDNSYGANAIGWGTKGHTFGNLTGSDHAEFIFKDKTGKIVMQFSIDYISAKSGTPSGFASLGPFGGDGDFTTGNPLNLLSFNTSLAKNLNDKGFCTAGNCTFSGVNLLVDSPPPTPDPSDDPYNVADQFDPWEFTNSYEMKISGLAFGTAGFGSVSVGELHNSPAKQCP